MSGDVIMENKYKKNINLIGKIGRIVSMILIVLTILASIATLAGTVFVATLPKEDINVTVNGTADISSEGDLFKKFRKVLSLSQEGDKAKLGVAGGADGVNIVLADDDNILEGATLTETEKGYSVDFNSKTVKLSLGKVIYGLVATLIYLICITVTLFMLRSLLMSLEKCDTPFTSDVISKIKNFGFSLIPFVVLRSAVESAWGSMLNTGADINAGLDFTMIIAILVVFMLAMIFSYGAELQKQSDETL